MNSELIVDIMYRKQHGNKNQLLRNVDIDTVPIRSVLYVDISMAHLSSENKIKKENLYKVWVGKELNFSELKSFGLGRLRQAEKLYQENPNVRFIVPANYYAKEVKIGKPDWFPSFIGNWDIVGEHDIVLSDRESLKDYLKTLKNIQNKVFENRDKVFVKNKNKSV